MIEKVVFMALEPICLRRRLEIDQVRRYLIANGHEIAETPERADSILFFGCAFNNYTEACARDALNRYLKYPAEIYILEGLADALLEAGETVGSIPETRLIRNREFNKLDAFFKTTIALENMTSSHAPLGGPDHFFVQVGAGCIDNCSYCGDKRIVKELKSKPLADCLKEIAEGVAQGAEIIELLGDDVGAYGVDFGLTITDLLQAISKLPGDFTLNMQEVNAKYLIRHLSELEALLPHLNIRNIVVAFQSGSNRILEKMQRGYTAEGIVKLLDVLERHRINRRFHAIVGFPGESLSDFSATLELIGQGGFQSGSLFKYQDRPGTLASMLQPKVSEEEKEVRLDYAAKALPGFGFRVSGRQSDKLMVECLEQ